MPKKPIRFHYSRTCAIFFRLQHELVQKANSSNWPQHSAPTLSLSTLPASHKGKKNESQNLNQSRLFSFAELSTSSLSKVSVPCLLSSLTYPKLEPQAFGFPFVLLVCYLAHKQRVCFLFGRVCLVESDLLPLSLVLTLDKINLEYI